MPVENSVQRMLLNGTLFNAGWLACVLLRNFWSVLAVVVVIGVYLSMEPQRGRAIILLLVATVLGFAVDNAMLSEGVIYPVDHGRFAPFWMTALWPLLATTFNIAFQSLQLRPILAAVLGGISAPLSYLAAVRFGAAEFGVPTLHALIGIGVVWAVVFPLGLQFARQLFRSGELAAAYSDTNSSEK